MLNPEKLERTREGCLEWTGQRSAQGYGLVKVRAYGDVKRKAHRIAWEDARGPIPEGLMVLHHCDNPPCCEVGHLYVGTAADNRRDFVARRRGPRPNARMTDEQVASLRERYRQGEESMEAMAHEEGVATSTIRAALLGRTYREVPLPLTPEESRMGMVRNGLRATRGAGGLFTGIGSRGGR